MRIYPKGYFVKIEAKVLYKIKLVKYKKNNQKIRKFTRYKTKLMKFKMRKLFNLQ